MQESMHLLNPAWNSGHLVEFSYGIIPRALNPSDFWKRDQTIKNFFLVAFFRRYAVGGKLAGFSEF